MTEIEKEQADFNRFMWKYLMWFFIAAMTIGASVWIADAYACGDGAFEDGRIEIKVRL